MKKTEKQNSQDRIRVCELIRYSLVRKWHGRFSQSKTSVAFFSIFVCLLITISLTTPETPTLPTQNPALTQFSPKEQIQLNAQTGNPIVDIANGNVPLGNLAITQAWSLLSLIIVVVGALSGLLMLISFAFGRKRDQDDEGRRRSSLAGRAIAIALSVLAIVVFLVLDNMSQPMVWINQWTIYLGGIFTLHVLAFVLSRVFNALRDTTPPFVFSSEAA